jgi:hypothetical protein
LRNADLVLLWDTLGDGYNEGNLGLDSLDDGVCSERRGDVDD